MTDAAIMTDRYPSRVDTEPALLERTDPVVHGIADDGPLTADQVEQFDRDGYLSLPGVFSDDEVQSLLDEMARLSRNPDLLGDDRTIKEPEGDEVRSIFEVHLLSDLVAGVVADARIADAARQLLGDDVYVHQSRINFKPGFHGKEFYWHSDFETWHTEDGMPAMRAVSMSIALTDNHEQNGPLLVIPGSHRHYVKCVGETPEDHYKESLRRQEVGVPDEESLAELVRIGGGITSFTGRRGSVTIFDCNAMHGSNSNITPNPRSNVFVVYNSVDNRLVEPFAGTTPRPSFIASREFTPVPRA